MYQLNGRVLRRLVDVLFCVFNDCFGVFLLGSPTLAAVRQTKETLHSNDPQGPDVNRTAVSLSSREQRRGAISRGSSLETAHRRVAGLLCTAKVSDGDIHRTDSAEEDVSRAEVPMRDVHLVEVSYCPQTLMQHLASFVFSEEEIRPPTEDVIYASSSHI